MSMPSRTATSEKPETPLVSYTISLSGSPSHNLPCESVRKPGECASLVAKVWVLTTD